MYLHPTALVAGRCSITAYTLGGDARKEVVGLILEGVDTSVEKIVSLLLLSQFLSC
jgi:hypothetical protein